MSVNEWRVSGWEVEGLLYTGKFLRLFSVRSSSTSVIVSERLSRLEAAIGIEPMNKGFAEIFSHLSQKNTEYQVGTRTTT